MGQKEKIFTCPEAPVWQFPPHRDPPSAGGASIAKVPQFYMCIYLNSVIHSTVRAYVADLYKGNHRRNETYQHDKRNRGQVLPNRSKLDSMENSSSSECNKYKGELPPHLPG